MKHGREKVRATLQRMLANGPITNLPVREADLEILLALTGSRFSGGRSYRESEVNDVLRQWIGGFCAPGGLDHVTLRRCLVDAGFLVRNKAGSTYEAAAGRIGEVIAGDARDVEPAAVLDESRLERENRRRERALPPSGS